GSPSEREGDEQEVHVTMSLERGRDAVAHHDSRPGERPPQPLPPDERVRKAPIEEPGPRDEAMGPAAAQEWFDSEIDEPGDQGREVGLARHAAPDLERFE